MKYFSILFLGLIVLLTGCLNKSVQVQPELGTRSAKILESGGYQFKDLNKNGELDKYEDWRLTLTNPQIETAEDSPKRT